MSLFLVFLASTAPLVLGLSQATQNGGSNLGCPDAPRLPQIPPALEAWADVPNDLTGDVYPTTGTVRQYDFTLSRQYLSPDGLNRSLIVVNGQYPGPMIEANWGDTIQVTVTNAIHDPKEGTAVHFHGMPHRETPYMDGVPSVHQCPIAPGHTFTYEFKAETFGTSWYHTHFAAQYMDGAFGPMIIHGPEYVEYDIVGPIILTDYTHTDNFNYILRVYDKPPTFLPIQNNLINGKMFFDCSLETEGRNCVSDAPISQFRFEPGKVHRLRLINTSGSSNQKFQIDNHELTVIANDFVPVQPYTTQVVTLGVGQRTDVLVRATGQPTDAVWMRADNDVFCANTTVFQPNATAAVYYPDADIQLRPNTTGVLWDSANCANDALNVTIPLFAQPLPEPTVTQAIEMTVGFNDTGSLIFFVDGRQFRANYSDPLLLAANNREAAFKTNPQYNVYDYGQNASIRLIMKNYFPVMHAMHLHGHADFWVLAEGYGDWDGVVTNPENPQRRDVHQNLLGSPDRPAYTVIQFNADNPGVWPLHCHLVVHASAGMFWNVLERPDDINTPELNSVMDQTCEPWNEYAKTNPVYQIDSGLRIRGQP